jgi:hypothetical protein
MCELAMAVSSTHWYLLDSSTQQEQPYPDLMMVQLPKPRGLGCCTFGKPAHHRVPSGPESGSALPVSDGMP